MFFNERTSYLSHFFVWYSQNLLHKKQEYFHNIINVTSGNVQRVIMIINILTFIVLLNFF